MVSNLVRTLLWTARGGVAMAMVWVLLARQTDSVTKTAWRTKKSSSVPHQIDIETVEVVNTLAARWGCRMPNVHEIAVSALVVSDPHQFRWLHGHVELTEKTRRRRGARANAALRGACDLAGSLQVFAFDAGEQRRVGGVEAPSFTRWSPVRRSRRAKPM